MKKLRTVINLLSSSMCVLLGLYYFIFDDRALGIGFFCFAGIVLILQVLCDLKEKNNQIGER